MTQAIEHLNPDTLSAFIDGELPAGEQEAIQQHLAGCHACALRVLSATQLKAATARAGRRFAPPPEALARLTAQLHRAAAGDRPHPLHSSLNMGRPRRGPPAGRVAHWLATDPRDQ
jgi:anti-sigma factor RsiW